MQPCAVLLGHACTHHFVNVYALKTSMSYLVIHVIHGSAMCYALLFFAMCHAICHGRSCCRAGELHCIYACLGSAHGAMFCDMRFDDLCMSYAALWSNKLISLQPCLIPLHWTWVRTTMSQRLPLHLLNVGMLLWNGVNWATCLIQFHLCIVPPQMWFTVGLTGWNTKELMMVNWKWNACQDVFPKTGNVYQKNVNVYVTFWPHGMMRRKRLTILLPVWLQNFHRNPTLHVQFLNKTGQLCQLRTWVLWLVVKPFPGYLEPKPLAIHTCHIMACHVMPCHAMPFHVRPCHAMPCHPMFSMSCHAMPCQATG